MDEKRRLEEEILASFDRGEWRQVKNVRSEIDRHAGYAKDALTKDKRVNIRISSRDLEDLQAKAAAEGVGYQTLMSSVLHKYVTGRLIEPPPPSKRSVKKHAR
jgi:predicted DNA binding CopG/RHH family protein